MLLIVGEKGSEAQGQAGWNAQCSRACYVSMSLCGTGSAGECYTGGGRPASSPSRTAFPVLEKRRRLFRGGGSSCHKDLE